MSLDDELNSFLSAEQEYFELSADITNTPSVKTGSYAVAPAKTVAAKTVSSSQIAPIAPTVQTPTAKPVSTTPRQIAPTTKPTSTASTPSMPISHRVPTSSPAPAAQPTEPKGEVVFIPEVMPSGGDPIPMPGSGGSGGSFPTDAAPSDTVPLPAPVQRQGSNGGLIIGAGILALIVWYMTKDK